MLINELARFRFDVQQKVGGAAKNIDIGQNAALRVQKKRVASLPGLKLLDVIGEHGMQQAGSIVAGGDKFAARREIQPCGAGAQGFVAR
jgi:hypothetical protein